MDAGRPRAKPLKDGRPTLVLALALGGLAAIAAFGFGGLPGEMRDFEVYWTAAARALHAEPLYRTADGHFQFKYLPAFAVLALPVAVLPLAQAKAAWFVISAMLLVALVSLSLAALPQRRRPAWLLATIVVIAMGKFFGHELVLGQVNLLFAVMVTGSVLLVRRGRIAPASGVLVGALAVKPYAILFLPWIAWIRGRTAVIAIAVGLAVLIALPAVIYGTTETLALHVAWWQTVAGSTAPNLTNNDNVSVAGMFAKWFGVGPQSSVPTLLTCLALIVVAGVVVARRRGITHPEPLEGALLLTLIPLISPQGWDYVFLVATPAIALFANYDDRLPPVLRWLTWAAVATIGLSLFDLMGRERYAAFMAWSVITVCFIVLVSALVSLRVRGVA